MNKNFKKLNKKRSIIGKKIRYQSIKMFYKKQDIMIIK